MATVGDDNDRIKAERARKKAANDLCAVSRTLAGPTPVEHVIG
jgi:uncharacterized OsmC-like protein